MQWWKSIKALQGNSTANTLGLIGGVFLLGCIMPYSSIQLHAELAKADNLMQSIISLCCGLVCAMIATMMLLVERIKKPLLRKSGLVGGIVLITVLVCVVLMLVIEAMEQ